MWLGAAFISLYWIKVKDEYTKGITASHIIYLGHSLEHAHNLLCFFLFFFCCLFVKTEKKKKEFCFLESNKRKVIYVRDFIDQT